MDGASPESDRGLAKTSLTAIGQPAVLASPAELRHELRTPLNQIIGYSEMLIEDARENGSPLAEEIERIHGRAHELVRLIQELLPSSVSNNAETMQRLRHGLTAPVDELYESSQKLANRGDPFLQPFAGHIETAARELHQFAAGESLPHRMPTTGATEERAGSSRARLLVADDSERNREVLCHQLERQGYSVTAVSDGVRALHLLRARSFDLVLLDVLMPELDGFATLESIKADPQLREIPVIMISASDEYSSVIRCIEGGAEDYLPKPFDPVLLRARLKASLEKKQLRDEQRRKTEELERAYQNLQKMQDQLVTQEKLASLGSLAAGIAHEIKNPLNFVTNFASLSSELIVELQQTPLGGADANARDVLRDLASNMRKIEEHGLRADSIVRGMLGHARKHSENRERSDLNGLLREAAGLAYHGLKSQNPVFNAIIDWDLDPTLPQVSVFPQDLSRVFLNIFSNAFYAVEEKRRSAGSAFQPSMRIQTRALPEAMEVRIRDNGNGIPASLRKKIFEPFFTTKPAGSGTGLGLSISHDVIVKEHRGELAVESEEGAFTEFVVRIPREVA